MPSERSVSVWKGRQGRVLLSDMMIGFGLCLSLFMQLPAGVFGHGYLIDPPSRSSAWRLGFKNPINYNDNGLYCGGFATQWKQNGGRCGVCGDPWNVSPPRPNEVGGKYGNGIIVRSYSAGQVVEMNVTITAAHGGWFEFRLCPDVESIDAPTTQECLDANLLEVKNGSSKTRYQLASNSVKGSIIVKVQLPKEITCPRCVLQWKWNVGNSWGVGSDGVGCLGCGPQEQFINCADISIVSTSFNSTRNPPETSQRIASTTPRKSNSTTRIASTTPRQLSTTTRTTSTTPRKSSTTTKIASTTPRKSSTTTKIASTTPRKSSTTRIASTTPRKPSTTRKISSTKPRKLRTATTRSPAISTTRPAATNGCYAIGLFEGDAAMDKWCVTNCALNNCPNTHCKCGGGGGGGSDLPDFTGCKSQGIWKSDTMDRWCVSNCAGGNCPPDFCQC